MTEDMREYFTLYHETEAHKMKKSYIFQSLQGEEPLSYPRSLLSQVTYLLILLFFKFFLF